MNVPMYHTCSNSAKAGNNWRDFSAQIASHLRKLRIDQIVKQDAGSLLSPGLPGASIMDAAF